MTSGVIMLVQDAYTVIYKGIRPGIVNKKKFDKTMIFGLHVTSYQLISPN